MFNIRSVSYNLILTFLLYHIEREMFHQFRNELQLNFSIHLERADK